jgi:hypothetical protein
MTESTMISMDIIRHMSVFNPDDFQHMSFLVIGAGAVGSSVALGLAKLGLTNITVMDDDKVEPHNLPNQYTYGPQDLEVHKVIALRDNIVSLTGTKISVDYHRYEKGKLGYNVVFMCVDTMAARKLITNTGLFLNPSVAWAFDTRIDAYQGMSYAFEPRDMQQLASYRETLYDDEEVTRERGDCGNVLSIGATAQIASQTTLWLCMQALTNKLTANEVITQVAPEWSMLSRKFRR